MRKSIIEAHRETEGAEPNSFTIPNVDLGVSPETEQTLGDWAAFQEREPEPVQEPIKPVRRKRLPPSNLFLGLLSRFKPADSVARPTLLGLDPATGEDRTAILDMTGVLVDFQGNAVPLPSGNSDEIATIKKGVQEYTDQLREIGPVSDIKIVDVVGDGVHEPCTVTASISPQPSKD